jgi:hypothetical protein
LILQSGCNVIAPEGRVAYDTFETMELALNLVWVCVAIVGIGLLCSSLSRAAARPDRPAANWRKIVAMSCALIILFFVISMTDDLHDQEIVVEENKSLRIVPAPGISALSAPGQAISAMFLIFSALAGFAPALPSARRPVDRLKVISAAETLCERLYGRAPPASLA